MMIRADYHYEDSLLSGFLFKKWEKISVRRL